MRTPPLMRGPPWAAAALLIGLAAAAPAVADDASGRWAVIGRVDGRGFTLDCKFVQTGQTLSGACVDGPTGDKTIKGGRSHPLTKGAVSGEKVAWTYQSSYGIITFGVDYDGVREGDHMSGDLKALGKTGPFTANRIPP